MNQFEPLTRVETPDGPGTVEAISLMPNDSIPYAVYLDRDPARLASKPWTWCRYYAEQELRRIPR